MFSRRGAGGSSPQKKLVEDEIRPLVSDVPHGNKHKIITKAAPPRTFNQKLLRCVIALAAFVLLSKAISAPKLKYVHFVDDFVRDIWSRAEKSGAVKLFPAYKTEYYDEFPEFKLLEDNYEVIRQEAAELLTMGDHIPRLKDMVQQERSESKVYRVDWKVFWFKMGPWIKPNCKRAPKTTALIKKIPNLYNAFFSVLAPNSHIDPHWGHYKGFLRYHLGLIVPNNNAEQDIFLRIRPDIEKDNNLLMPQRELELDKGEHYYWHEGEGVMFDDNPLHDATNWSNETRVVLFLDVERIMPWQYRLFNRVSLFFANRIDPIASMRKNAVFDETKQLTKVAPEVEEEFAAMKKNYKKQGKSRSLETGPFVENAGFHLRD